MALSRRTGVRFQASIWPGFVDAMTGLLLVLMFVLTIFMVVQFVLRETISGQEVELNDLAGEVAALAQALGLEEQRSNQLDLRVNALNATLIEARGQAKVQANIIATLTSERDTQAQKLAEASNQITVFEAQVAGLLGQREESLGTIAELETEQTRLENEQTRLISEQEALNLALAANRTEIDAQSEAARLAASKREALEALIADLEAQGLKTEERVIALEQQLVMTAEALSAEEAAKMVEAAAAQVLRNRLENADAELTAMTLSLEAKRREAEETLTLLAAARLAQGDLNSQLVALLSQVEDGNSQSQSLQSELLFARNDADNLRAQLSLTGQSAAQLQVRLAAAGQEVSDLQAQVSLGTETAADIQARLTAALAEKLEAKQSLNAATLNEEDVRKQLTAAGGEIADLKSQVSLGTRTVAEIQARLTAALAAKLATEQSLNAATLNEDDVRKQLTAALAAKLQSEQASRDLLSATEQQALLLENAQNTLSKERVTSAAAQRQTELLNQQVAALRTQLQELSGLLDLAEQRDQETQVQLQSLGSDLNTALARAVAEERRRRVLEEQERKRLEAETAEERRRRVLEEQERKRLEAETKDLAQYRSEFFGRLRDLLGNQEGVRIDGDRFVFSSEVLFPPGGAQLSPLGEVEITKIATILRGIADEIPPEIDWVIRVDGHTDNVPLSGSGEFAGNWELSQARALSVVKYMANVLAIPPSRLAANGFGQYQPINTADTPEARAQNRRIELKFTEK
ncbi:MAG: peptidoglycan -binding protein [Ascidiaceihabitans sp.]|jgi:chemotaxis protein MotB|nr:peptidoglycan -binding protein [Ascidiaceihabitans sp.]